MPQHSEQGGDNETTLGGRGTDEGCGAAIATEIRTAAASGSIVKD
jgi:hypothetical protein